MIQPFPFPREVASLNRSLLGAARLVGPLVILTVLTGCHSDDIQSSNAPLPVRAQSAELRDYQASVTLSGEIRARVKADLSFRVSGRVIERFVDVGAHVNAGDLLARIDPAEQQADVDAADAAVAASEAQLRVAQATFDRQRALMVNGFTTRTTFDQAQADLLTAQAALETAKAQLGSAKDAFSYTSLVSSGSGVITARNVEVGQIAQAAQSVFTLALDGPRDAVFEANESLFFQHYDSDTIHVALISYPFVTARGVVREVSPTIDRTKGTVRVKVGLEHAPPAMSLGSAVAGTALRTPSKRITLPWSALAQVSALPAVWAIDPSTHTVSLRPIQIETYTASELVLKGGVSPGEQIVVEGGKKLSQGQKVSIEQRGEEQS